MSLLLKCEVYPHVLLSLVRTNCNLLFFFAGINIMFLRRSAKVAGAAPPREGALQPKKDSQAVSKASPSVEDTMRKGVIGKFSVALFRCITSLFPALSTLFVLSNLAL